MARLRAPAISALIALLGAGRALPLTVGVVYLTGCTGLFLRPEDSTFKRSTKVAARVVLGVSTLGISEVIMAGAEEDRHSAEFYASLDRSVGGMTYDDFLTSWGPSVSIAEGRNILVATWGHSTSGPVRIPIGGSSIAATGAPIGGIVYSGLVEVGWELRLVFDRETQLLKKWTYQEQ